MRFTWLFSKYLIFVQTGYQRSLALQELIFILFVWKSKIATTADLFQMEWMIVVQCQFSNFSAISWREQVNFQRDDDEVRSVLDQHAEMDFYSASSLKQQYVGRHVAPLAHIIMIPSQPRLCSLSLMLCA